MTVDWHFKTFAELSTTQLYAVLQLRSAVFVVEQACIFHDIDGTDDQAMHLMGTLDGTLVAYARCFAAGVKYPEIAIGRVISHGDQRGTGLGHQLMAEVLKRIAEKWGVQPIRIGAQARLAHFYATHGFVATDIAYCEDGIDHIELIRPA